MVINRHLIKHINKESSHTMNVYTIRTIIEMYYLINTLAALITLKMSGCLPEENA